MDDWAQATEGTHKPSHESYPPDTTHLPSNYGEATAHCQTDPEFHDLSSLDTLFHEWQQALRPNAPMGVEPRGRHRGPFVLAQRA